MGKYCVSGLAHKAEHDHGKLLVVHIRHVLREGFEEILHWGLLEVIDSGSINDLT